APPPQKRGRTAARTPRCRTPVFCWPTPGSRRPLALPLLSRADHIADLHGCDRQRVDLDTERPERVLDRRRERRRHAHPPTFAAALNAILGERRRRHDMAEDRKSTRLNSSHVSISYAVFCLKKKRRIHDSSFYKNKRYTLSGNNMDILIPTQLLISPHPPQSQTTPQNISTHNTQQRSILSPV